MNGQARLGFAWELTLTPTWRRQARNVGFGARLKACVALLLLGAAAPSGAQMLPPLEHRAVMLGMVQQHGIYSFGNALRDEVVHDEAVYAVFREWLDGTNYTDLPMDTSTVTWWLGERADTADLTRLMRMSLAGARPTVASAIYGLLRLVGEEPARVRLLEIARGAAMIHRQDLVHLSLYMNDPRVAEVLREVETAGLPQKTLALLAARLQGPLVTSASAGRYPCLGRDMTKWPPRRACIAE